jgi:hypothetical protein
LAAGRTARSQAALTVDHRRSQGTLSGIVGRAPSPAR